MNRGGRRKRKRWVRVVSVVVDHSLRSGEHPHRDPATGVGHGRAPVAAGAAGAADRVAPTAAGASHVLAAGAATVVAAGAATAMAAHRSG